MSSRYAVDSSVLIAIFNEEAEADKLLNVVVDGRPIIGAPTLLETRIWCLRRSRRANLRWLDDWITGAEVASFDREMESGAARAYERFGKALHSARLNYGDAMAYAIARSYNVPLLFKGGDFSQTDVAIHPASIVLA